MSAEAGLHSTPEPGQALVVTLDTPARIGGDVALKARQTT